MSRGKYPKFLRKNPSFLGLQPFDLILIGICLIVSLIFRLETIQSAILILLTLLLFKLFFKGLDLRIFFLMPKPVKTLDLTFSRKKL